MFGTSIVCRNDRHCFSALIAVRSTAARSTTDRCCSPLLTALTAAAHRAHRRDRGKSRERESLAYKTITDRRRRISSLLLANLFVARVRLVPSSAQSSPLCTSFVSVSTLVCYRTVRLYVPTHRFSRDRKDATPPSGKLRFLVAVSGHRTVRGHCW